jgi:LAO/AO transport system kinase
MAGCAPPVHVASVPPAVAKFSPQPPEFRTSHFSVDTLADSILSADRRAVARAISAIENGRIGSRDLIDALYPHTGRAWRIGITGPPGAGKSTTVDRLIEHFRAKGERVGCVAVDPSSPFSGGALLGDRVRMRERVGDDGLFYRSLASRGARGGLSEATEGACDVLDAAGFDVVMIETVGVGQGELDVAEAADTVAVIVVPESGDAVQAMKAGLMEIADVFAVNKADHPEAGEMVAALREMLRLRSGFGDEAVWTPPVLKTVATEERGVDVLVTALDEHRRYLDASSRWRDLREERLRRRVRRIVETAWREEFWSTERRRRLDEAVAYLDGSERAPYRMAERIRDTGT